MDEATLDQAMDPFFTTKRHGTGSGMGLAVVHGIVSTLNGSITIKSKPSAGTEITIALPAHESNPISLLPSAEIPDAETPPAAENRMSPRDAATQRARN